MHAGGIEPRTVRPVALMLMLMLMLASLGGCVNYGARASQQLDQIIKLEDRTAVLQDDLKDSNATIVSLRDQLAGRQPRIPTLPESRLNELLTPMRVELQGSIDASSLDAPGKLRGYRVYFRPVTDDEVPIPATGTVTIEAFDLALQPGPQLIGTWKFTPVQLKDKWYAGFGLNHFAVNCPWTERPKHDQITFKITDEDALTGRVMTDQKSITLHLAGGQ